LTKIFAAKKSVLKRLRLKSVVADDPRHLVNELSRVDGKLSEDRDIAASADPGTTCVFIGKASFTDTARDPSARQPDWARVLRQG
jgi:hypothetical protein